MKTENNKIDVLIVRYGPLIEKKVRAELEFKRRRKLLIKKINAAPVVKK